MAVRKIEYTVSADGINPSVKQFAGVQGEHRATELVFKIEQKLYESLTAQAVNGAMLIYRIDGYDGEGGLGASEVKALEKDQTTINYFLEEWLTRFGGTVKAVLVISLLKEDLTEMELFCFPALLQLKNLPEGSFTYGKDYKSMSTLAQIAKESSDKAVEASAKTEQARAALENGTVWVFDGGNAEGSVDVEFVVDQEINNFSNNAIANKVIKAYVDGKTNEVQINLDRFKEEQKDYIIEHGEVDVSYGGAEVDRVTWHYEKWKSGKSTCDCSLNLGEVNINSQWGSDNIHYFKEVSALEFPKNLFIEAPKMHVDSEDTEGNTFATKKFAEATNTGTIYCISPRAQMNLSVRICIEAKGRWKE